MLIGASEDVTQAAKGWIADQVQCCASPCPPGDPLDVLRAALGDGRWAAQHGRILPMAPLLDLKGSLEGKAGRSVSARQTGDGSYPSAMATYDAWIAGLVSDTFADPASNELTALGVLSLAARDLWRPFSTFLSRWDLGDQDAEALCGALSLVLARAYDQMISNDEVLLSMAATWQEPRTANEDLWKMWWSHALVNSRPLSIEGTPWAELVVGERPLLERLDLQAAWIHDNRALAPCPGTRSRRLSLSPFGERPKEDAPFVGAPEEESILGSILWSTLALGDYGDWMIAQKLDRRMNELPPPRRPSILQVHIGWAIERGALDQVHRVSLPSIPPHQAERDQRAYPVRASSIIAALGLLMLDDLRGMFAQAPVRLMMHRYHPCPFHWDPSQPQSVSSRTARLHLLRRIAFTDLWSEKEVSPDFGSGGGDAFVLITCLSQDDLPAWGIAPSPNPLKSANSKRKLLGVGNVSLPSFMTGGGQGTYLAIVDAEDLRLCEVVSHPSGTHIWEMVSAPLHFDGWSFSQIRGMILSIVSSFVSV